MTKGYRAEHRIDSVLTDSFLDDVFGWSRNRNSKQVRMITALRQAKTYIQSLRLKNDKLNDCIMSNELLDKENDRLRDALSAISFMTPALGGTKSDMQRALLDIDKICRAILDGDDE